MTDVDFKYIVDFIKSKRQFFTMICAGPPDSGKTVFTKCLIKEIQNNFGLTLVFSGSFDEHEYYSGDENNPIVPPYLHFEFDLDFVGTFITALERLKQRGRVMPCLLIFDDFSGSVAIHNNPLFRKLIARSKHLKCGIILNVHFISQVDPTVRSSVNYITAFRQDNLSIEYLANTVIGYNKKSLLVEYNYKMNHMPKYSALFIQRLDPYEVKQVLYMLPIGTKKTNSNVFQTDENDNELKQKEEEQQTFREEDSKRDEGGDALSDNEYEDDEPELD